MFIIRVCRVGGRSAERFRSVRSMAVYFVDCMDSTSTVTPFSTKHKEEMCASLLLNFNPRQKFLLHFISDRLRFKKNNCETILCDNGLFGVLDREKHVGKVSTQVASTFSCAQDCNGVILPSIHY